MTTGRFTKDAKKEAELDGAESIDLIDGSGLCSLLKELKLGVETKEIVIVDYNLGNITSIQRALSYLGYKSLITNHPEKIARSEKIILLPVSEKAKGMKRQFDNADFTLSCFIFGTNNNIMPPPPAPVSLPPKAPASRAES